MVTYEFEIADPEPGAPGERGNNRMVYDPIRKVAVFYGGANGAAGSETWEYDGSTWSTTSPASTPGELWYGAQMAYDTVRNSICLYGGRFSDGNKSWVWEYNVTTWTNRSPAGGPGNNNNENHFAYDIDNAKFVAWRQWDASTWLYDSSANTWAQQSPAFSPPANGDTALAYDPVRGRVVMFGGTVSGSGVNTTYEWDGSNWATMSPATTPAARYNHGLEWSTSLQKIVMYGGQGNPGSVTTMYTGVWTWDGTNWELISASDDAITAANHESFTNAVLQATRHTFLFCDGGGASGIPGTDGLGGVILYGGTSAYEVFGPGAV